MRVKKIILHQDDFVRDRAIIYPDYVEIVTEIFDSQNRGWDLFESQSISKEYLLKITEEIKMDKMKPCPFCGTEYDEKREFGKEKSAFGVFYRCPGCGIETDSFIASDPVQKLREFWNKRKGESHVDSD